MPSRMEKYNGNKVNTNSSSRISKNEDLYQNLYTNSKYIEFDDNSIQSIVGIDSIKKSYVTREDYHKAREYDDILEVEPKVFQQEENIKEEVEKKRTYDINNIIEEAKKNREVNDELEKRRKLKNTQYNILANLNPNEIEEYHKQKYLENKKYKEEELKELINTITSKNLVNEIKEEDNKDLLNDLMPTNINETIITESISKQILDKEFKESTNMNNMDTSFYSKSMDFSDKDFEQETSDDFRDDVKDGSPIVTILIIITIVLILAIGVYLVVKNLL